MQELLGNILFEEYMNIEKKKFHQMMEDSIKWNKFFIELQSIEDKENAYKAFDPNI